MTDRRRLWRAENQEISIIQNLFEETYQVEGTREKIYIVDLEKPSCECPDWQKRSPAGGCKHMLKVKLKNGTVDPLRSEKTNTSPIKNRSQSNYSKGWASLSKKTKERDHWECQRCGSRGGQKGDSILHAHHILPKSKGGEDRLENLITVCHDCHEQIHGHPIPVPDATNLDASGTDYGSSTQQSQNSVQSGSENIDMHTYGPVNTQNEPDIQETYLHSKHGRITPDPEVASQKNIPDEPNSKQGNQVEKSEHKTERPQLGTSTDQTTPESSIKSRESHSDESLSIVGTVWACIGLTLAFTVVLPPFVTFARWKLAISAALCAIVFIVQQVADGSSNRLHNLTGAMIFTYVSVTMIVAYFP